MMDNRSELVKRQTEFVRDLCKLIAWILGHGWWVRIDEVRRPLELQEIYLQKGVSWTKNSAHLVSCAADLYIYDQEGLLMGKDDPRLEEIGNFWEGLHPKNRWGGHYSPAKRDVPHFERMG